jgi:tetratricopeptide (TPR) repeat protein
MKQIKFLLLALLISQTGLGQVKPGAAPAKKPVAPVKKSSAPPRKPGMAPAKKTTTEDMFKRYLVTEDTVLAGKIIQAKDSFSFYGFYCQAVLAEELEDKITYFTKFIDVNPKVGLAKAYLNRGAAYVFSEKYDLSLADFDKSISLDPKEKYAFHFRGLAYNALDQEDKAIQDFNQVIKMMPTFMLAYQMRGSCFLNTKDFKNALVDLNRVIKAEPYNDQAYLLRGMAYDGTEQYELAIADYKEAKKLNKDNSDTVSDLIGKTKEKMKGKK